jgi:hypothetical protein
VAVEPDRSAGIALVRDHDGQRDYYDQSHDSSGQPSDSSSRPSRDQALPTEAESPVDLASVLPSASEPLGVGNRAPLPGAGELVGGGRTRPAIGGAARTQVFGVAGEGARFVYVFDRSGSMDGFQGRPLAAAKSQLLASLDDLDRVHQFQIIFYNEQPQLFNPDRGTPQLVWADQTGKDKARRFVRSIRARGGTRHVDALLLALNMHPDVIFFLTDADEPQLTVDELALIRRRNQGTSIHAIEFGFGARSSRDNFLARLARENGGRHAYVDVSRLTDNS